jgi:hypothetical protein
MKTKVAVVVCILLAAVVAVAASGSGKPAQTSFSLASLKGSYAGLFSGEISTPAGMLPILGTGVFTADGAGKFGGTESYTVSGHPCTATVTGTYKVDPDGSGTLAADFKTKSPGCVSGSYTQNFAIAEGGRLVLLTNSNADRITEKWYRQ